jgi:hypothetical protein
MMRVLQARKVNMALGGAVVGPGDVDKLQDDLLLACDALTVKVPEYERPKGGMPSGKKSSRSHH